MTIIEKTLDNDVDEIDEETLLAIRDMPDRANKSMLKQRRANTAEKFAVGDLTQLECIRLIKEREEDYLDMVDDDIRETIGETVLRMEAQDTLSEMFYEKLKEEGIVE